MSDVVEPWLIVEAGDPVDEGGGVVQPSPTSLAELGQGCRFTCDNNAIRNPQLRLTRVTKNGFAETYVDKNSCGNFLNSAYS